MNRYERILIALLRISGAVMLLATPAVVMPRAWMAAMHEWLRLGVFPDGPIVDYLARSASALYALLGALLLFVSRDVKRFAPVIKFMAYAGLAFGAVMLVIDFAVKMPAYWSFAEGPFIIVGSLIYLYLVAKIDVEANG